ncbi:hypothetical protein SCUCBS95973_007192 [Sporothrix curviconia]|uniref:EF-hand domain-containing protein n=1 Tax=Sporothrix curviconia TaxID=1260050 RepID=A0ABP0CBD8_9PEZI
MASADHDGDGDIGVDELDSAAIAAAMGFSSFGTQAHPNKKRRFNPQADAVIGAPRDNRPPARLPGAGAGTGANATRLPPRPPAAVIVAPAPAPASGSLPLHPPSNGRAAMKLPPPTVTNADEIDLNDDDDDDDDDDGNDENNKGGGALVAQVGDDDNDDEPGPQYLDTSRPVGEIRDHLGQGGDGENEEPAEDGAGLQARIDAVVAAGNAAYGLPPRPQQHQLDGASHSTGHSTGRHQAGVRAHDLHGFRPDLMPGASRNISAAFGAVGGGDAANGEFAESEMGDMASQISSVDGHSQGSWQARGHGHGHSHGHGHQRDWWTGYYDPTSNENPWARVEANLGLSPCEGSWLQRGHGRGQNRGQQQKQQQYPQPAKSSADEAPISPAPKIAALST